MNINKRCFPTIKPQRKEIKDKIRKYDTGINSRFQYIKILANKMNKRRII